MGLVLPILAVVAGSIAAAPPPPAPPRVGMANPASVACVSAGGKLEIVKDVSGGEIGLCRRKDGSVCEEWALFRTNRCVLPPPVVE